MALRGVYVVRGDSGDVSADVSETTNSTNTAQRMIARTRGMETSQYARDQRPMYTDTGLPSTFSLTRQEASALLQEAADSPYWLAPEDLAEGGLPRGVRPKWKRTTGRPGGERIAYGRLVGLRLRWEQVGADRGALRRFAFAFAFAFARPVALMRRDWEVNHASGIRWLAWDGRVGVDAADG